MKENPKYIYFHGTKHLSSSGILNTQAVEQPEGVIMLFIHKPNSLISTDQARLESVLSPPSTVSSYLLQIFFFLFCNSFKLPLIE